MEKDIKFTIERIIAEEKEFRMNMMNIPEPPIYQDLEDRKSEPGYRKQVDIMVDLLKPYGIIKTPDDIIAIHYFSAPLEEDMFGNGGKMYQRDYKDHKGSHSFHVRISWDDSMSCDLNRFIKDHSGKLSESIRFDDQGNVRTYTGELSMKFYFKWMERKLKIESI